ncbi:MAG: hypothetical protein JXA87_07055 [Thermoleophilia bacterium]|nr:hypothetical protein [Thermoleophilia bacterium]
MKKRTWRTPLVMTGLVILLVLALAVPALADPAPAGEGPASLVPPDTASLTPPGTPSPLSAPPVTAQGNVLWEQVIGIGTSSAWAIQYAPVWTNFVADDFTNTEPWTIGKIFLPAVILNAPETPTFTWAIYADDGNGKPNGVPYDGVTTPFWSLTLDLSDPQVTVTSPGSPLWGGQDKDLLLTLDTPIMLPAGHWWLVPYGTFTSDPGAYRVGWFPGTGGSGAAPQYSLGESWNPLGPSAMSFRLETSARALKEAAAEHLETARANSTNPVQRNLLSLALSSVEASLSDCYWIDEHHLKELTGSLVFGYERTAVSLIRSAMRLGQLQSQADPLSEAIDLLVTADRMLASTALDGARKGSWLLPLAEKSLAKGDSYAAAGRPELAIEAYKAAWRYAVTGCERWTPPQ